MSKIKIIQRDPLVFEHEGKSYFIDGDVHDWILRDKNIGQSMTGKYNEVFADDLIEYIESHQHEWQLEPEESFPA